MTRAIVTGCAGFIGSHLSSACVAEGWEVLGIDAFTPYYARADKERQPRRPRGAPRFELRRGRPRRPPTSRPLLPRAASSSTSPRSPACARFGDGFARYTPDNMLATQRVFEAARAAGCPRVVWASSSSVYGDAPAYPCVERDADPPRSPYGVTKRACEDLAGVYAGEGLDRRPALLHRLRPAPAARTWRCAGSARRCWAAAFPLFGDGSQSRDFTYVTDAVDATLRAAGRRRRAIYNVGGGHEATLAEVIARSRSSPVARRARPPARAARRRAAHRADTRAPAPTWAGRRGSACRRAAQPARLGRRARGALEQATVPQALRATRAHRLREAA